MANSDAHHTTFYIDNDIYHYIVMSFGLINTGATYQMIVKSVKGVDHVEDLRKNFECIRPYQVRLNPTKCAFGVHSVKFIGYMVSQIRIEVNLEKLEAIEGMKSPTCHREVQSLNGRLAVLNRFLAKAETGPFYSSKF